MKNLDLTSDSKKKHDNIDIVQGVRGQSGFFNWALTERNIQVRLYLKVVLKFSDVEILIFGVL